MSDVFGASSQQSRQRNNDGSWNIYCFDCGDFIAKTFLRVQRAQCELCRRVLNGEPLTNDAIRAYKLSKAARVDVSGIVLSEEPDLTAVGFKKFSLSSMAGDMIAAIGRFATGRSEKDKAKARREQKSSQIALSKRRGRLFANVDLGSIDDVDKNLKGK